MKRAFFLIAVCGCAKGVSLGALPIDSGDDDIQKDAPSQPIDAPAQAIDAAIPIDTPVSVTLSETVTSDIVYGGSWGCSDGNGKNGDVHYYRTFALSDFSITTLFHAQQIVFGVQESDGSPTITVLLASYTGDVDGATVDSSMMTTLGTAQTVAVPPSTNMVGENVAVPYVADIPAGSKFVVEISVPNQTANNHYMYIGATTSGEHHPGYYSSQNSACGPAAPETSVAAGATGQFIINVVGSH
jgi:hypothetical protein